jgi:hypothetical protein
VIYFFENNFLSSDSNEEDLKREGAREFNMEARRTDGGINPPLQHLRV